MSEFSMLINNRQYLIIKTPADNKPAFVVGSSDTEQWANEILEGLKLLAEKRRLESESKN